MGTIQSNRRQEKKAKLLTSKQSITKTSKFNWIDHYRFSSQITSWTSGFSRKHFPQKNEAHQMPNKRKVEGPYSVTLKPKFAFYACQNIALSNSPHLQTNNDLGSFGSSAGTLTIQVPRKCNINFLLMIVCNTSSKEKVLRIIAERIIKEDFLYPIKFSHLVLPREFACSFYFFKG